MEVIRRSTQQTGDVVLVTGGNGFLGQHIVHLLQTQATPGEFCEIRVLDMVPYKNKMGERCVKII